jgi:lambda repressor-like predicted transcriptional regulator
MNSENTAAIAALQKNWGQMKDLNRALAVRKIHQDGTSLRALAKDLDCSPTLLRHLNLAAQAPTLDQSLARQGEISTRELARRGRTEQLRNKKKEQETAGRAQAQEVVRIANAICEWLETEGLSGGHGEQIVDEARRLLANAEATKQLPPHPPVPPGTPLEEIIEKMRPPWPAEDRRIPWLERPDRLVWYAEWLTRSVFFALPDSISCHRALNLALDKQIRG